MAVHLDIISALTTLGDPDVFATALGLFVLWLWVLGLSRTIGSLVGGLAIVALATVALKTIVATPGATLWPDGTLISQYFPSGHAALATGIYGSLSILLAGAGGGAWRYAPLGALALSAAIAAGRVITRMHPIGDAFFGVILGLASPVTTYFGMAYEVKPLPGALRILLVFAAALAAGLILPLPVHEWVPW
jgi:membrane-associated phospholipid phosphatase